MSFILAELEIPARVVGMAGVDSSMAGMLSKLKSVESAIVQQGSINQKSVVDIISAMAKKGTVGQESFDKVRYGAQQAASAMGELKNKIQSTTMQLTEMAGTNLGPMTAQLSAMVTQFGLIGIAVAAVVGALGLGVAAGAAFIKHSDEVTMLGEKFRYLGMDVDSNVKKLEEFTDRMKKLGVAGGETRAMIDRVVSMGKSMDQAINQVRAAQGLANAGIGLSISQAQRLVQNYEEVGSRGLSRILIIRNMIRQGKGEVEIQQKLNDLIKQGNEMREKRLELTVGGSIEKMKVALDEIWEAMKKAFGPPVIAIIKSITNIVEDFVDILKQLGVDTEGMDLLKMSAEFTLVGFRMLFVTIEAIVAGFKWLIGEFPVIIDGFKAIGESFKIIADFFSPITNAIKTSVEAMRGAKAMKDSMGDMKGDVHLEPGMTTKATLTTAEKLWEKIQAGAVMSGPNTGQQTVTQLEQLNSRLSNWAVTGVPVMNSGTGPGPSIPGGAV